MERFLKNSILYFLLLLLIIFGSFSFNKGSMKIDFHRLSNKVFFTKASQFSKFIKNKESINLILGSSLVEDAIIPDSLGKKWYSFTNEYQNIYESFKFLDAYKDSIRIDTILIGLIPFDFPKSFVHHYSSDGRSLNGGFYIYGQDSITTLKKIRNRKSIKRHMELIKKEYLFDFEQLIKIITKQESVPINALWSEQGFSGRINAVPLDLDSLFLEFSRGKKMPGSLFNRHTRYFRDVATNPNFYYFNLFDSLVKSLDIETIYLITPQSKYYEFSVNKEGLDKKMNAILYGLKQREISLWNYQNMDTDKYDFLFFWDETHISHNAAKVFSKIISNRLKN